MHVFPPVLASEDYSKLIGAAVFVVIWIVSAISSAVKKANEGVKCPVAARPVPFNPPPLPQQAVPPIRQVATQARPSAPQKSRQPQAQAPGRPQFLLRCSVEAHDPPQSLSRRPCPPRVVDRHCRFPQIFKLQDPHRPPRPVSRLQKQTLPSLPKLPSPLSQTR